MRQTREDKPQRVIIIGLGRFGRSVAQTLYDLNYEVTAIDTDAQRVAEVTSMVTLAAQGDGADEELLRSLDAGRSHIGIVAQGRVLEANLLTTLLLKRMGVPRVVAKATSALHGDLLRLIGADGIIFPERDAGLRLAHALAVPSISDYISLSATSGVARFTAPAHFADRSLSDLHADADAKISVLLIQRGNLLLTSPSFEERLRPGDELVVAGPDWEIEAFIERRDA